MESTLDKELKISTIKKIRIDSLFRYCRKTFRKIRDFVYKINYRTEMNKRGKFTIDIHGKDNSYYSYFIIHFSE